MWEVQIECVNKYSTSDLTGFLVLCVQFIHITVSWIQDISTLSHDIIWTCLFTCTCIQDINFKPKCEAHNNPEDWLGGTKIPAHQEHTDDGSADWLHARM